MIGGYALGWTWTGYQGNTLWDWLSLLLLPLVVPTALLPGMLRWVAGEEAWEVSQRQQATASPEAAAAAGPESTDAPAAVSDAGEGDDVVVGDRLAPLTRPPSVRRPLR